VIHRSVVDDAVAEQWPVLHQSEHGVPLDLLSRRPPSGRFGAGRLRSTT
jgi:hypothetical protein